MWCIIYSLTKQLCSENFHARCGKNIKSITKTCAAHRTPVQSHRMCIWVLLCLQTGSLRPFIRMRSYLSHLIKSIYHHEQLQTSGEVKIQFSPTKNKSSGTKHSRFYVLDPKRREENHWRSPLTPLWHQLLLRTQPWGTPWPCRRISD